MKKGKYILHHIWAMLYFFFNNVGLPGGLLYTNILSPVLYVWIAIKQKQLILWPLLFVLLPYNLIHLALGVHIKSFVISNLLFISTYLFVRCAWLFINHETSIRVLFKNLLIINFGFTLLACVVYCTPFKEVLWYKNKLTHGVENFYRLSLFTFEASYYALIFSPIAFYYLLKVFFRQNTQPAWQILLFVLLPLVLSFSLGVIAAMAISFIIIYVIHFEKIFYKQQFLKVLIFAVTALSFLMLLMWLFYPNNPLFVRIENIIAGVDSSTKGRTSDSFYMAWLTAKQKSIWFGSGLGQIKELAYQIVKQEFNYWGEIDVVRIPNAVAETLAIFGISGLLIRFCMQFYLFFKTNVLNNYYQTALFLFAFTYQFTGSYITNIVEYVLWIFAFSNCFKEFNVRGIIRPLTQTLAK